MASTAKLCCGIMFSIFGCTFLAIVGILLRFQPHFIRHAKNTDAASTSCFEAAGLYGACILTFSVMYWRNKSVTTEVGLINDAIQRDRSYFEISEAEEGLPLAQHMSPAGRSSATKEA